MSAVLQIDGLSRTFGGIKAIDKVSFTTDPGIITGLIGPNGAGKTTLFNVISGTMRPTAGKVRFNGDQISGKNAAAVARRGLVRTFQMTTVFPDCSVLDNLYRSAMFRQFPSPQWLLNPVSVRRGRDRAYDAAQKVLDLIDMRHLATEDAASLAYGLQKILGVGMALTTAPTMLLMDEPAAGLNPVETTEMADLIERVHGTGVDIVLVEHDMQMIMRLCEHIVVLVNGTLLADGPATEVQNDPRVIDAYLGADLESA